MVRGWCGGWAANGKLSCPLIGHSVRLVHHGFPKAGLSIHWDDGRGGIIDLDTLEIVYVYD